MQELRYLHAIVDAQANQGVYAKVGVEQFAFFQCDALFRTKQAIEVVYEIGIDMQEEDVENAKKEEESRRLGLE